MVKCRAVMHVRKETTQVFSNLMTHICNVIIRRLKIFAVISILPEMEGRFFIRSFKKHQVKGDYYINYYKCLIDGY